MKKSQTHDSQPESDTEREAPSEGSVEDPWTLECMLITESGESVADSLASIAESLNCLTATFEKAAEQTNKTNKILCKLLESIDETLKGCSPTWTPAPHGEVEDDSTNAKA